MASEEFVHICNNADFLCKKWPKYPKSDSGPLYSGYVTCNKFQTEKQEIRILLTKIKHITKLHGQKTETTYSGGGPKRSFSIISTTRQSKQCRFSIYTFDNLKSKPMVRLVRAEKMVLSGLVFARKIARMILIQNI